MAEEKVPPSSRMMAPTCTESMLNLRIVTLDYYMARPIPDLDACYTSLLGQPIAEVPIVRIFGTTLMGQKMCLHLHKAFPYMYVPYEEDLPQDITSALAFVRNLASAIEKALKLASHVGAKRQHVYSCCLVRGKKFYGFHTMEQLFVKIVLYYPQEVQRLSGLLLGGGILNRRFQPYESHIPFLLQIMVDYNLAGMGHIHLSDVKFRPPMLKNEFIQICSFKTKLKHVVTFLANHTASSNMEKQAPSSNSNFMELWCTQESAGMVACGNMLPVEKQSTCELEGDATVEAILNQYELTYVPLEQAGPEVKMVQSLLPIWDELDVTGSMNGVGLKRQSTPSNQNAQAAEYVDEYQRILERILDQEGPGRRISDVLSSDDEKNHMDGSRIVRDTVMAKRNALLQCTQAAYSKSSIRQNFFNEELRVSLNTIRISEGKEDKDFALLDEDMIKHQLSRTSQDTDEEAVELLRWMDGYCSDHEKQEDETSWSQAFQCADDALAKFVSDYELSSQLECQAIIDCSGEALEGQRVEGTTSRGSKLVDAFARVEEKSYVPQFDGTCDHEDAPDSIMLAKSEGELKSFREEKGWLNASQELSKNDVNPVKHGNEYQRKGWGPRSTNHCESNNVPDFSREKVEFECGDSSGSEMSLNAELLIPSSKMPGVKKDLVRPHEESYRDVSENTLSAAKQSVRDLMRSKRQRRQQTDAVVSRAASANVEGRLAKEERLKAADGMYEETSASLSRSSSEKEKTSCRQPEERLAQSLRFGPLPLVMKCAYAPASKACFTSEEDTKGVKPCPAQEEVGTGGPSLHPTMHVMSDDVNNDDVCNDASGPLQGFELLFGEKTINSHAYTQREQVNNGNCTLVDRDGSNTGEGTLSSHMEPLVLDKSNAFMHPSVPPFECCLVMLAFTEKAPTAEHLLATFKSYGVPSAGHKDVFYGNAEDLPDQPAVMAGMVFKVRSQEVDDLPPYQFLKDTKADADRRYVLTNTWAPSIEDGSAVLPSHFQNDGTVSYLLSPVKPPPTRPDVSRWLKQSRKGYHVEYKTTCKQNACWKESSQNGRTDVDNDDSQPSQLIVPSSPKYDEMFDLSSFSNEATTFESYQKITCDSTVGGESASPSKLVKGQISRSSGRAVRELPQGRSNVSQISAPTANNQFTPLSQAGFKDPSSIGGGQQTSVLSIEVFASTRGDLRPDPRYDAIRCIVMVMHSDMDDKELPASQIMVLLCDEKEEELFRKHDGLIGCEVFILKDEASLLRMFIWFVRMFDPDMLVGWEIQGFSLGLLAERAANLGIGLLREISRLPATKEFPHGMDNIAETESGAKQFGNIGVDGVVEASLIDDEWGRTHGSGIHVGGRIVLNLWRIMRGEIKLGIYSVEAVAEAILKRKLPLISLRSLTEWFSSGPGRKRYLCVHYVIDRARLNLQIMDQLDLVNRTSELARVFGIDFFSVLSRGSQYRVESMMLRVAHSQNFLLISPSRQQVALQPAMQCLPLVMEPESRFYTDPVVVLDFQSLYPSMMIAYNLCFSTCLGKLVPDNPKVLGVTLLDLDVGMLRGMKDSLTFTPNGIMFVSSQEHPGVLPRLLDEILSTRIMVKQTMKKLLPTQRVLSRVLNARQLALKLISNVTYGYTAAGFSGRMPCAELADSIVQAGRYTLESAINVVNTNEEWNARVIYGDTDSMFVLLKGRSRDEAFRIGEEIAAAITKRNPHPVTLKMEKVYHPCALLTKKRYVGYSFESREQVIPKFDAKGIETVRRDSCGAVAKTLEKSLRILFETHDLSQVKAYLHRQWSKIIIGRVSLKDFIFAKEVRLGTYSTRASVLPPAAIVATKAMSIDPRAEPRYGERVPYLVIHGEPGARLVDMVIDPYILVSMRSPFRLHDTYYITKQIIPALQRIFGLVGVDLTAWYHDMPRLIRPPTAKRAATASPYWKCPPMYVNGQAGMDVTQANQSTKHTIDHYYLSQHCIVCGGLVQASCSICKQCSENEVLVNVSLLGRSCRLEREYKHLIDICRHCGGGDEKDMEEGLGCISLACSVFYERIKVQKECRSAMAFSNRYGSTMQLFDGS